MKKRIPFGAFGLFCVSFMLVCGCQSVTVRGSEEAGPLGPQSTIGRGEQRVLMVAVRFPDAKPSQQLERIRKRVVAQLNDYVRNQSYGRAWVKADFRGWVDLPD